MPPERVGPAAAPAFTTFASGNAPTGGAVLGTFDPTLLPNGLYEIQLEATDFKGQSVATDIG